MKAPTITRRFQFCAGHRVHQHESKCRNLHGHNYVALIEVECNRLDNVGRVIDFSAVKAIIGQWLEEHWDHAFIAHADDEEALRAVRMVEGQKLYVMPTNPTAENMASHLMAVANTRLRALSLRCCKVVLYETENCSAEVRL